MKDRKGSALVEMAALAPLYILMLFSIYYLGNVSSVKLDVQQATYYFGSNCGDDSAGEAEEDFIGQYAGELNDFTDDDNGGMNCDMGSIYENLTQGAYEARSYYAMNDQGELEIQVEDMYVLPINFGIFDLARNDSYIIADQLNGWYSENDTSLDFTFDPEYISLKDIQLPAADISIAFKGSARDLVDARAVEGDPSPIINFVDTYLENPLSDMPDAFTEDTFPWWVPR